jgi:hypothetical protein
MECDFPARLFFDTRDIPPGWDFEDELRSQIERSAVIAIRTDAYGSRPWCRRELMIAKKSGCAIIVVDALTSSEDRSFPYLGNVPTIRWDPSDPDRVREVLNIALRELLRVVFTSELMRFELGEPPPLGLRFTARPPEAAYVVPFESPPPGEAWTLVYPDPPLPEDEAEVIRQIYPRLRMKTLTQWLVSRLAEEPSISGLAVGLSISSEGADLRERGFSFSHTKHIFHELVRQLLAAGAVVYFGGNLRRGWYARSLIDLVRQHRAEGFELGGRIINFIAWPYYLDVTTSDEADGYPDYQIKRIEPPATVTEADRSHTYSRRIAKTAGEPLVDDRADAVIRACMTEMREALNREVRARVMLGGFVETRPGKHAGLAEEALLALSVGMPVYLLGGLGGATEKIIDVLKGEEAPESFMEFGDKLQAYRFTSLGGAEAVLKNGLNDAENERLFRTEHIVEMVSLVLTGLARSKKSALAPPA